MEKDKKKRSPNYTNEEKQNLLTLVTKFKGIIECKRTGAFYIQKKKEAWMAITRQYNSQCTTGPRDEGMLKHFYNNIKHRARKISAGENKLRYLADLNESYSCFEDSNVFAADENKENCHIKLPVESSSNLETVYEIIDENVAKKDDSEIQDLKKKWIDEKRNIKKTGGGSFDPVMTDADHQVLAILDEQIQPDENPYDDAAAYFGEPNVEVVTERPSSEPQKKPTHTINTYRRINKKRDRKTEYGANKSAELLKKIYFKKKIELVYYQKKNEMQKFRNEQRKYELELKKHELEMKVLRKQLENADCLK